MVVTRRARWAIAVVIACAVIASGPHMASAQSGGSDPGGAGTGDGGTAGGGDVSGTPDTSGSSSTSSSGAGASSGAVYDPSPAPPPPADEPAPGTSAATTGTASTASSGSGSRRDDEDEGDGRTADLLWIEAGVGYGYSDIVSFNNDNFLPGLEAQSSSGLAAHVAAGIRILFLTLGARGTLGTSAAYDLWSILFDAMLRLPIPVVEPYFRFGIGYAFLGRVNYMRPADSEAKVYGLAVEGGAGVDIFLANVFSIGAGFDFAFLNMTRQSLESCGMPGSGDCNVGSVNFQETGDAAGFQIRATGHAALHF